MTTTRENDAAPAQGDVAGTHTNNLDRTPYDRKRRAWEKSKMWADVFGPAWQATNGSGDTPGSRWSRTDGTGATFEVYNVEGVDADGARAVDPAVKIVDGVAPFWWSDYDTRPKTKLIVWAGVNDKTRTDVYRDTGVFDDPKFWSWFWSAPGLSVIQGTVDRAKKVTRWHALGAALAWTSANISTTAYIGGEGTGWPKGSLNLFVCNIAGAGGGKNATASLAEDMVKFDTFGTATFTDMQPGHARVTGFKTKEGIEKLIAIPEAVTPEPGEVSQWLANLWTGDDMSSPLATRGLSRRIRRLSYRVALLASTQSSYADAVLNRRDGGLTQRFLFFPRVASVEGRIRDGSPAPAPIRVGPGVYGHDGQVPYSPRAAAEMTFNADRADADDVLSWDNFAVSDVTRNGHRDQLRAKTAAIVNVLNGGDVAVTDESWDIAGHIVDVSELTALMAARQAKAEAKKLKTAAEADRAEVKGDAEAQALDRRVLDVIDTLSGGERRQAVMYSKIKQRLGKRQRDMLDDALARLKADGSIGEKDYGAGKGHGFYRP